MYNSQCPHDTYVKPIVVVHGEYFYEGIWINIRARSTDRYRDDLQKSFEGLNCYSVRHTVALDSPTRRIHVNGFIQITDIGLKLPTNVNISLYTTNWFHYLQLAENFHFNFDAKVSKRFRQESVDWYKSITVYRTLN